MFGFLNINKPAGFTSHDCVARVRKILGTRRVGHSGTLDPMAVGVLPIAVNQATRLLPYLPGGKVYRAVIKFGQATTTDDREGEIIKDHPCPHLTLEQVKQYLLQFIGPIEQLPPRFSAIKIGGHKLYDLARSGTPIELPRRSVTIESIAVLAWHPGNYPQIAVEISCGPGTYIRSIARDWGALLGCGGMLVGLERTFSNGFHLSHSIDLEMVTPCHLISPDRALSHLGSISLDSEQSRRWQLGQKIPVLNLGTQPLRVAGDDQFLGIGKSDGGFLHPQVVFKLEQAPDPCP